MKKAKKIAVGVIGLRMGNSWARAVDENPDARLTLVFDQDRRRCREVADRYDVIVCWRHNWPECPEHLEVVELKQVIQQLAKSDN